MRGEKNGASLAHSLNRCLNETLTFRIQSTCCLIQFGRSDKGVHLQGGQDNFYVDWVFALELKLSKTLSGLVYFVLQL